MDRVKQNNRDDLMNKKQETKYSSLDVFDTEISLYNLVPSSQDAKELRKLKLISEAYLLGKIKQATKPLSVLITGSTSKKTHGRAFLRSLGADYINEVNSYLLGLKYGFNDFACSQNKYDALLLSNIENLSPFCQTNLHEYLRSGFYSVKNMSKVEEDYPWELRFGNAPIVLTTSNIKKVQPFLLEYIDYTVAIQDYDIQFIELAILSRIKFCGIEYESEKVLKKIVNFGLNRLDRSIYILKESITVMNSESEIVLLEKHIDKAMSLI